MNFLMSYLRFVLMFSTWQQQKFMPSCENCCLSDQYLRDVFHIAVLRKSLWEQQADFWKVNQRTHVYSHCYEFLERSARVSESMFMSVFKILKM